MEVLHNRRGVLLSRTLGCKLDIFVADVRRVIKDLLGETDILFSVNQISSDVM